MVETVLPVINNLSAPFWRGAAENRLVLPFCSATDRFFWPPSPYSPFATGGAVEWRETSPSGVLRALVVYRRGFQKAFQPALPYGIGLVALDCGVRLQAHLPNVDRAPAKGARVQLGFAVVAEGGQMVPVVRDPKEAA